MHAGRVHLPTITYRKKKALGHQLARQCLVTALRRPMLTGTPRAIGRTRALQRTAELILVVESDDEVRGTLVHALEREGFRVVAAIDVAHALEYVRRTPTLPGLILFDETIECRRFLAFHREVSKVAMWSVLRIVRCRDL